MTPDIAIVLAGAVIAIAGFGAPLLSGAFCTRNSPRWVRNWRDVALGILGARLVTGEALVSTDQWWVALLVVNLAVAQGVIFWCNTTSALREGDRCP